MKTQLIINNDTAFITSDEEITSQEKYIWMDNKQICKAEGMLLTINNHIKNGDIKKIIAGIEGLPSINWNGLKEEFGLIDVEKVSLDETNSDRNKELRNHNYKDLSSFIEDETKQNHHRKKVILVQGSEYLRGFKESFTKFQSLNDKKFSLEDIKAAIDFGKNIRGEKSFINDNFGSPYIDYEDTTDETIEFIQSLQQPKVFEIEIELETINQDYRFEVGQVIQPKIKNNSIKIIKKL